MYTSPALGRSQSGGGNCGGNKRAPGTGSSTRTLFWLLNVAHNMYEYCCTKVSGGWSCYTIDTLHLRVIGRNRTVADKAAANSGSNTESNTERQNLRARFSFIKETLPFCTFEATLVAPRFSFIKETLPFCTFEAENTHFADTDGPSALSMRSLSLVRLCQHLGSLIQSSKDLPSNQTSS